MKYIIRAGLLLIILNTNNFVLATERKSDTISNSENYNNDPSPLNSFIDKLFQNFLLGEKRAQDDLSFETNENKIFSKKLEKYDYANERDIHFETSEYGVGAIVRVLDKIYGTKEDLKLLVGSQIKYGSITLDLKSCFYKKPDFIKDALALIRIKYTSRDIPEYMGWLSSNQAYLTNYGNYRYRFWLLNCIIESQE